MDGRRRAGVGGQNCDGALLMARPLSGHAHPVRRQRAPPQAMVDRSEPRHISQLHCGSDHDLGRHAGDPHGQTTTWGRYTPILTVALRRRASSPCLKVGTQAPQTPWRTVTNRAFECLLRGFWAGEWITSGDPNAQCNSASTGHRRRGAALPGPAGQRPGSGTLLPARAPGSGAFPRGGHHSGPRRADGSWTMTLVISDFVMGPGPGATL